MVCEVVVRYAKTEVKRAISDYLLRVCRLRVMAWIVYPILAVCTVGAALSPRYVWLAVLYALTGLLLYVVYYRRVLGAYEAFYAKKRGGVYRFGDEQVCVTCEEVQSQFKWSVFKKAYEVPSAFLLLDENRFVYLFPKACFAEAAQVDALREMLREKVSGFRVYVK